MSETEASSQSAEQDQTAGDGTTQETQTLLAAEPGGDAQGEGQTSSEAGSDAKSAETEPAKPEAAPAGPPASYELKPPEGLDVPQDLIDAYATHAKANGLTQDAAQQGFQALVAAKVTSDAQRHAALVQQWREETVNDKDIGGERLQSVLIGARQVIDAAGSPELLQLLETTGLGNNRLVLSFLNGIRQLISEDRLAGAAQSGRQGSTPADPAKVLFPYMN